MFIERKWPRVFCSECAFFLSAQGDQRCKSQRNEGTYLEGTAYHRKPRDINMSNDCQWFITEDALKEAKKRREDSEFKDKILDILMDEIKESDSALAKAIRQLK